MFIAIGNLLCGGGMERLKSGGGWGCMIGCAGGEEG